MKVIAHRRLLCGARCIENLDKLSSFLANLTAEGRKFSMESFFFSPTRGRLGFYDVSPKDYARCGAVACALGWAPAAGVEPSGSYSTWSEFFYTEFDFPQRTPGLWDWLFAGSWTLVDNTPEGASARILYARDRGIPLFDVDEFTDSLGLKERQRLVIESHCWESALMELVAAGVSTDDIAKMYAPYQSPELEGLRNR